MSRYRLQPTREQEAVLLRHCADARYVWNLAVEQHTWWRRGRKSAPGYLEQCRQLTAARADNPWLAEGSQTVQQQALSDFTQAMSRFFAGTHSRPSWRKAGRGEGFRIVGRSSRQWDVRRLNKRWGEVRIPKAGWVRFRWSRQVPEDARSFRVTRDRSGRWHVAFASIPDPIEGPGTGDVVGIDRGVAISAALSTGEMLTVPGLTAPEQRRLRRLERKLSRAKRGSNRRKRVKLAVARLKAHERDRRKDWAEKASTSIARRFDVIRVEALNIRSMTRSAKGTVGAPGRNVAQKAALNRAIRKAAWGLLVRRLEDKAPGRVEKVSPAYTSQRCSACGLVDARSRESQAVFACTACGYTCNADVNAAKNIAAGHAVTARGGDGTSRPANREPQLRVSLARAVGIPHREGEAGCQNRTMISRARQAALSGIALAVTLLSACSGGGGASQPADPASGTIRTLPTGSGGYPAAAWPTYNRTPDRAGVATGVSPVGGLSVAWRAQLDGAVYGQPLLIGSLVVAATENDSVYALDSATGKVAWHQSLGAPVPLSSLPCGNIDPLGITGTPVYDQANGVIYVVAETTGFRHTLFGLSVGNGAVQVERYIPTPDGNQRNDQQRPALAIADGRVYVAFGGLNGDCGQYQGSVVGIPLTGHGPMISYVVPTSREGAIWGTAGPVRGPNGDFYVSAGNGAQKNASQPFDGSDSVAELTPGLQRAGIFAPATWAADNASDSDLGSTQPALAAGGAVLIVGKRGTGYLLRAGALGGVGSELAQAEVCKAFGAAAVSGDVVYEPCRFTSGITAVQVSVALKEIKVLWRGPSGTNGSPVVGGGAVWVTNWDTGTLYALSPATGTVLQSISLGSTLPHFSSLSLAGSHAYVGTLNGVVAVSGA